MVKVRFYTGRDIIFVFLNQVLGDQWAQSLMYNGKKLDAQYFSFSFRIRYYGTYCTSLLIADPDPGFSFKLKVNIFLNFFFKKFMSSCLV